MQDYIYTEDYHKENLKAHFLCIASDINRFAKPLDKIKRGDCQDISSKTVESIKLLQQQLKSQRRSTLLESEIDVMNINNFLRIQGMNCFEVLSFHKKSRIFTKEILIDHVEEMFSLEKNISIIHFSGHGSQEDGQWELSYRSRQGEIRKYVDISEIAQLWKNRNRDHQKLLLIISDSCHSGKLISKLKKLGPELYDETICIQASCGQGQYASDTDQGGIFTQDMMKILRKEKDQQLFIPQNDFYMYQNPEFWAKDPEYYKKYMKIPLQFKSYKDLKFTDCDNNQPQQPREEEKEDQKFHLKIPEEDQSLEYYDKFVEENPFNHLGYTERAYYKWQNNLAQDGIKDIETSLEINQNYPGTYNIQGVLREEIQDYQGALKSYEMCIKLDPKFSKTFYNRGNLKTDHLNDHPGALADYNQAIQINPQYSDAFVNRALLKKYHLNDHPGALADYNQAIQINPQFSMAFNNRGYLYMEELKKYKQALADFDQALKIDPNDQMTKNNRKECLDLMKK